MFYKERVGYKNMRLFENVFKENKNIALTNRINKINFKIPKVTQIRNKQSVNTVNFRSSETQTITNYFPISEDNEFLNFHHAETISDVFEQDTRRYARYLGNDSEVII